MSVGGGQDPRRGVSLQTDQHRLRDGGYGTIVKSCRDGDKIASTTAVIVCGIQSSSSPERANPLEQHQMAGRFRGPLIVTSLVLVCGAALLLVHAYVLKRSRQGKKDAEQRPASLS